MNSDPNLSYLKDVAREQLTIHLGNFYGKKDLVIDPDLMAILDRITGVQFLKQKEVDKIYKLEHKEILGTCDKSILLFH